MITAALFGDVVSLAKSKLLLDFIVKVNIRIAIIAFVIIDIIATLLIVSFGIGLVITREFDITDPNIYRNYQEYNQYFETFPLVFMFSTMLTSIWILLFSLSGFIVWALIPFEYVRRFVSWWFKDVDTHPLTAITKVMATLIVIGAFIVKVAKFL
jgi:hypothetical protein